MITAPTTGLFRRLLVAFSGATLLAVVPAPVAGVAPATWATTATAAVAVADGWIAFESIRDGSSEIYTMNADGTGQTRLTDNPAEDLAPAISPDGTTIAFHSHRDDNAEIYLMNADGTNPTNLTTNPANDFDATFSPDGTKIAYASNPGGRGGNSDIHVMNADGSDPIRLTTHDDADVQPTFSPDGTEIAFLSDRDGNSEVYVMNADGTGQTNLTHDPATEFDPTFSPDGTTIAFTSDRDGDNEIHVMNADGTNPTNLTTNDTADAAPAYSPDGTKIAFQTERNGNAQIYTMNADGTGPTNRSNHTDNDLAPDWGPPLVADSDPPETTITGGPEGPTNDDTPTFTFTSSEVAVAFECRIDDGAYAPCESGDAFGPLGDGSHTFSVRASDLAGNVDPSPATTTWTIDTTPPQTTITSGPPWLGMSRTATFTFASSEPGSTFQCRRDDGGWQACTSPHTYTGVRFGRHIFEVRAIDLAGNTDPTAEQRTWNTIGLLPF